MSTSSEPGPGPRPDYFATTHWTVVLAAGRNSTVQSAGALEELCRTYWYPLYSYARHRGYAKADAEDLVQGFFARFLERNYLSELSAEKGRFRAFLLMSFKHFLANEWDKVNRQKRGGGVEHLSLDWEQAEGRYQTDSAHASNPERAFDREWALTLLERVIERLRLECVAEGKAELFGQARGYLMLSEPATPYAEAARTLGVEEGAVRVAVHRLRARYRELLRQEIAHTLSDRGLVQEELQALQHALSSG